MGRLCGLRSGLRTRLGAVARLDLPGHQPVTGALGGVEVGHLDSAASGSGTRQGPQIVPLSDGTELAAEPREIAQGDRGFVIAVDRDGHAAGIVVKLPEAAEELHRGSWITWLHHGSIVAAQVVRSALVSQDSQLCQRLGRVEEVAERPQQSQEVSLRKP